MERETNVEKMRMESVDLISKNVEKIAELFPECVTEAADKDGALRRLVDFDKLRHLLSGDVAEEPERYDFTWVGKRAALAEAHTPVRKTLRPCPEESRDWDTTQNLYIEGDNLDVLKLLQESYLGKVKMIYIDPPYNTGSDSFVYPDNYRADNDKYEAQSEMRDEDGNKTFKENNSANPRFHSDWCSMIYPRLLLARNLLTEDGLVFISIDDNEFAHLKEICLEIFGTDNYIADLIWDLGTGTSAGHFARGHEYILCFAKDKTNLPNFTNYNEGERITDRAVKKISYKNPAVEITFPTGFEYEGTSAVFTGEIGESEKEFILSDEMRFENGKLVKPTTIKAGFAMRNQVQSYISGAEVFDTKGQRVVRFYFNNKGILSYEKEKTTINPRTVLTGVANTKNGTNELNSLFGKKLFDFPKPSTLIGYLLKVVSKKDSVVMDFFSGSATTAHAVMQLNAEDGGNRRFIMVQLPEPCDPKSEAAKAGYSNICEIGKERIRRAGDKIKADNPETTKDLNIGFRVLKVDSTNMNDVYYGASEVSQDLIKGAESNVKDDRTDLDLLFGCLLDWGLPLSLPYKSEEIDGVTIHDYNGGDLIACFAENVSETVVTTIAKRKPIRAVFRDSCFETDAAKINVTELFKRYAPDARVKTI